MLRRLGFAVVIAALATLPLAPTVLASAPMGGPVTPPSEGTGASCVSFRCGIGAVDPGAAGAPGAGPVTGTNTVANSGLSSGGSSTSGDGGGSTTPVAACTEQPMNPQPAAGSPWWEGKSAADGQIVQWVCTGGMTPTTCIYCTVLIPHFAANGAVGVGAPAPPPPPTPEELAQQAYQLLSMPDPAMHFGPDDSRIAVRYWLYLWVGDPGPVTATVTAGAVSVTATATVISVVWTMGEPVSAERLFSRSAPINCEGLGVDPGPHIDTTVDPAPGACAYMYNVRSTPERTGGSGTWPVTATADWSITWAANTGQVGTLAAPPRVSTTQVSVGAWSTVMVADGASVPGG